MKSFGMQVGSWLSLWLSVLACGSVMGAEMAEQAPKTLRAQVIEDIPGRLVLELTLSGYRSDVVDAAAPAIKVGCEGCHASGRPGAPDLPVYRFDVLSGANPPSATLRVLESEILAAPGGIASFPRYSTPVHADYVPEAGLYREAGNLSARILEGRHLRGAPIRGIEVPLALLSGDGKTVTLLKRLQVSLEFGPVLGRPATNQLEGTFRAAVKNPVGGAYLYESRKPGALRKRAAAKADLGTQFVKIRIGDRNVESLSEDRMYGLAFSDLIRLPGAGVLNGVKIGDLRLFAGPRDSLPRKLDLPPSAGALTEIPIDVVDANGPGTFDEGDTLKFFGHGTSLWKRLPYDSSRIRFEFSSDPYSFENYYYLGFQESPGSPLRLGESPPMPAAGSPRTSTIAYLRAEKDAATAACDPSQHKDEETGYAWHWFWKNECLGRSDTVITLTRANLASEETRTLKDLALDVPGDSVLVGIYTYESRSDSIFKVFHGGGGDTLEHVRNTGSPGTWYALSSPFPGAPDFSLDSVKWGGTEKRFEGYTVSYRRNHVFSGDPLWIFPSETGKPVSYRVRNAGGAKCLRVENGVATRFIPLDGEGVFTDSLGAFADAGYFLFRDATPVSSGAMEMEGLPPAGTAVRNLADGDGENPDYLIVTSRALLEQAVALKEYRNHADRALRLKTSVVLVEDIYRLFSGGRMSPMAIRDFLRLAYSSWGGKAPGANPLKYVLFFGDGHYDYRNIVASKMGSPPPNIIPPFEFLPQGGRGEEVASDDFYGVLEAAPFGFVEASLDVAIGRIPVQNPEQAADYLRKIKDYEDPAKAGEWRGRVVLAADDAAQKGAKNDLDPIIRGHTTDTENLGKTISRRQSGTTIEKVYLLDYPMSSVFTKPEAAKDLLNLINRGAVMINFVGHGSSNQWADEVLLQTNDALSRLRNAGKTPLLNAFSCTVGRFESLKSEGMSEQFVKQKSVGAIGAVSATRESYPRENLALADAFYERAFPADSSDAIATVGEALRDAKNASETSFNNINDAKYGLLGEPVLLMRKPRLQVSFTRALDTIKALDCDTIRGRVEGGSGNGFVNLKIVAGAINKVYNLPGGLEPQVVDKRGAILFERTFAYKDNAFATQYFIPKQISFGDSTAQILVFAWDAAQEREGTTSKQNLRIRGTGSCASDADGKGPRIRITGCEKKETGDVDFPDQVKLSLPYCLQISVEDSVGGVLSSEGPDEGTTVEIAGVMDPFHPQPGIDELNQKTYQVPLEKSAIRPGSHLLKVSARDGYGNISLRQMRMDLTLDSSLNMVSAFNAPNPMKRGGTTFYFSTVLPSPEVNFDDPTGGGDRLEFEIRVFDQRGHLVRVFERAESGVTSWDGRDRWGGLLGNGVYFYKVTARQDAASLGQLRPEYRTVSSKRNILVISR